jgi:hypothetical protein
VKVLFKRWKQARRARRQRDAERIHMMMVNGDEPTSADAPQSSSGDAAAGALSSFVSGSGSS